MHHQPEYCQSCPSLYFSGNHTHKAHKRLLKNNYYCLSASGVPKSIKKTSCKRKAEYQCRQYNLKHRAVSYTRYSDLEKKTIKSLLQQGVRVSEIAVRLARPKTTIYLLARLMGFIRQPRYTEADRQTIIRMYTQGDSIPYIARKFNRTPRALQVQITLMRKAGYNIPPRVKSR